MAGHANKDGLSLRGGGVDVTSDCLKAVIEFIGPDNSTTVNVGGVPTFEITVKRLEAVKSGPQT